MHMEDLAAQLLEVTQLLATISHHLQAVPLVVQACLYHGKLSQVLVSMLHHHSLQEYVLQKHLTLQVSALC